MQSIFMAKCLALSAPHQKLSFFGRLFLVSYNLHQSKVTITGILCRQLELPQFFVKQKSLDSRHNQYILKLEAVPFAKVIYNNFFYCHSQLETFLLKCNQYHNSLDFFSKLLMISSEALKYSSFRKIRSSIRVCITPTVMTPGSPWAISVIMRTHAPPEAFHPSMRFKVQIHPFWE